MQTNSVNINTPTEATSRFMKLSKYDHEVSSLANFVKVYWNQGSSKVIKETTDLARKN